MPSLYQPTLNIVFDNNSDEKVAPTKSRISVGILTSLNISFVKLTNTNKNVSIENNVPIS